MTPFIKKIVGAQVRVLLYYGDTDMACNFMMGQQFASQLGYPRQLNKTPWKFNKQIAGFKTLYKGVTFITIRGAGVIFSTILRLLNFVSFLAHGPAMESTGNSVCHQTVRHQPSHLIFHLQSVFFLNLFSNKIRHFYFFQKMHFVFFIPMNSLECFRNS